MRYVDRAAVGTPPSLIAPNGPVAVERQKAQGHYSQMPSPTKPFKFKAYKGADVVAALETLFSKKCAYCESKYSGQQPVDVEHFRPKGAGAEAPSQLRFWWLGSEWTKLLPCCSDCNRKRKHNHVTLDQNNQATVTTDRTIAGKKDAFPLHGPLRANGPNDPLQVEQPLLIDPTLRDPGQHIDWWINELRFPMMTARLHGAAADPFAAVSIKVLGLNRQGLVEERGSLLQDLAATFEIIRDLIRAAGSMAPSAQRDETIAKAVFHLNRVRAKGESTERYSAVARAYVGKAEQAIGKELNDALQSLED